MGRVMWRTRSPRKIKLPFNSPKTSRSPSGYSAEISAPSSLTRSAIVSASYAMRLTARPARRGSAIDAFTVIGHHRPTGPGGRRRAAADSRNPHDLVVGQHDGPHASTRRIHTRIAQQPLHAPLGTTNRHHPIARVPGTHRQRFLSRQLCTPQRNDVFVARIETKITEAHAS